MGDPKLILMLLLVAVLVVAGGFVLVHAARWVKGWSRRDTNVVEPFTLHDLRQMAARGDITQAEYEHLRESMLGRQRPATASPDATKPAGRATGFAAPGRDDPPVV